MAKQTKEERLEKIKQMLSQNNGEIDEDLKKEVQTFTKEKRDEQIKQIAKQPSTSYNSEEVISNLASLEPPDIVKESIKKTLSSMLDPLRSTFAVEIAKYSDAISIEKESFKMIPRAIRAKKIKKIENGKFVPILTGEDGEKFTVNPEFKQLLSTGYKPSDDNEYQEALKEFNLLPSPASNFEDKNPFLDLLVGINKPTIGTPDSDYIKNYIGGDQPARKKEKIKIVKNDTAGIFKNSFSDLTDNIKFNSNQLYKEILLNGYSIQNNTVKNLRYVDASNSVRPNWTISYREAGAKYYLNIDKNIEYFYNNKTTIDTSSYYFVGNLGSSSLNNSAINLINSINTDKCNILDNKELYSEIMSTSQDLLNFERPPTNSLNIFKNFFNEKYDEILSSFINDFFSSYKNNRLLRKFNLPKIDGLQSGDLGSSSDLIILNLLNFIPQISQELIDCGKQPHPLNLDLVIDLMTKKFNSIGIEIIPKKDFCNPNLSEEPKNPITEAAGIGTTLIFLRLCIFENLLKTLFILDEHQYSFDILDSSLLTDYIYIKTLEELNKFKLSEDIENIIEENYEFFKDNLKITEQDEKDENTIEKISVNKRKFDKINPEMKNIIKHLIRRNLGFIKNLIGVQSSQENIENLLLEKISKNKIYDIQNDQTLPITDEYEGYSRYSRRFSDRVEKDFMCLEKYIDAGSFETPFIAERFNEQTYYYLKEKYNNVSGYTNIKIYEKFLQDVLQESALTLPQNITLISGSVALTKLNYFLHQPKICLRLIQNWLLEDAEIRQSNQVNNLQVTVNLPATPILPTENLWSDIKQVLNGDDENAKNNKNNEIKQKIKKFLNNQSTLTITDTALKRKKICGFYDINVEENKIKYYNSSLISENKINLSFSDLLRASNTEVRNLDSVFNRNKQALLNFMTQQGKYQVLTKRCFFLDKLPNLAVFYSHSALSNSQMDNLFNSSKKRVFNMYDAAVNIKNYKYKNETDKNGGASKKYQDDMANVGDPSGGVNLDLLQFLITTPILILKGITQLMDPNIAIASQIVNAAASGLLFPKLNEQGQPIGYPGDKIILPTVLASLALLPVNIFAPLIGPAAIGPPVTPIPGMLYWALEPLLWKLPFFQNQAANSDAAKKLKDDPSNKGLKIGASDNFSCNKDQDE